MEEEGKMWAWVNPEGKLVGLLDHIPTVEEALQLGQFGYGVVESKLRRTWDFYEPVRD